MSKFTGFVLLAAGFLISSSPAFSGVAVLCPNEAATGGYGSATFTSFAGSLDGTGNCSPDTETGVTMSISDDTDYAKLTWGALPAGTTLGNLSGVNASVSFTAGQSSDSPFYELAFVDSSDSLGQGSATDQILLLEFQNLGISGAGFTSMTIDPGSTLFNVYDNTTDTYLLGGQSDAMTLDALLGTYSDLSSETLDEIRLAIGMAGPGCSSNCGESLSVDSVEITPEPGTIALALSGLAAVLAFRRRA